MVLPLDVDRLDWETEKLVCHLLKPLLVFFSCIAERVRDMVGQLLEIPVELKTNWMFFFPALPGEYETWSVNYWKFEWD